MNTLKENVALYKMNAHYQKMSPLFYMLNGITKPNLKQVYITSLLDELHNEVHRSIAATKKELATISIR